MKLTLITCAVVAALALTGCEESNTSAPVEKNNSQAVEKNVAAKPQSQQNISSLYLQASQTLFKQRAPEATMFGLTSEDVGKEFNNQLPDFSPENEANLRQQLANLSEQISSYQLSQTTNTAIDNQQVMAGISQYFAGHKDFPIGYIDAWMGLSPFIVNQINGPLIDVPRIMQNDQPITTEQEAVYYISRLGKFDQMLASIEEKLTFDSKQDWFPPKSTVTGAIRYLKGFTNSAPKAHVFVTNFSDKVHKIASLTPQQKQQLIDQAIDKVTQVVYPAYQSMTKTTEQL